MHACQFLEKQSTVKPPWLRRNLSYSKDFFNTRELLRNLNLNTVCKEAACPNKVECWSKNEATFIILGKNCTRNCLFCNIDSNLPEAVNQDEPEKIGQAVGKLQLDYVVITSVTRDDLKDKGTEQFVKTVQAIKSFCPRTIIEILIPDMGGNEELIWDLANSGASVIGHNIEMAERLYSVIRPKADYKRSLSILRCLRKKPILTKSAIMVGLGEEWDEIGTTLEDLNNVGVDIVHIGQYLQPTKKHYPVYKYYTPRDFNEIRKIAKDLGFKAVNSGPMVRSSYNAKESYESCNVLQ